MRSTAKDAISKLDSVTPESFATDAERYEAKEAARRLLARLETPFERGWALAFETPVLVAGLQTCLDLDVWASWARAHEESGGAPQTLDDVVGWCGDDGVEPNLLRRFLKHMAALYFLEETDVDAWRLTPYTLAMGQKGTHADQIIQCGTDHTIPAGINLPRFLKKHRYRDPVDKAALDNYADMTGGPDFFAACAADPERLGGSFVGLMTALRNHKMPWTEVYDTAELVAGADLSSGAAPLFVDVGGMHGLDAARLLARHPELPPDVPAVVVQDTPEVVAQHPVALDPRIAKTAHDFFAPQPLAGARAYFFHAVPHDWPDADCVRMFGRVREVFGRGYSRLLIYEVVLPARGATGLMTTLDLQLMSCVSGLERTEGHWRRLLGQAGFKINGISRHPRAVESVIEAELV